MNTVPNCWEEGADTQSPLEAGKARILARTYLDGKRSHAEVMPFWAGGSMKPDVIPVINALTAGSIQTATKKSLVSGVVLFEGCLIACWEVVSLQCMLP